MRKAVTEGPALKPQLNVCVACGANSSKRPTRYVCLTQKQVLSRSNVITAPLQNPFFGKGGGPILLCTEHRRPSQRMRQLYSYLLMNKLKEE